MVIPPVDGLRHQGLLLAAVAILEVAEEWEEDEVVIDTGADEEDQVPHRLQVLERLPAHGQGEGPNEDGADAVQHHPGRGAHLLRDGESGEVEECDADDEPDVCEGQLPVVTHLDETVDSVLESDGHLPEARIGREVPGDEEHRDEEHQEDGEAEDPLPADALERRDLVLLDDLLLDGHLDRGDSLRQHDEEVPGQDHVLALPLRLVPSKDVVPSADDAESQDHHDHARPLKPLEAAVEEGDGEDSREDDHASPQHLKTGGEGPSEPKVHGAGACEIAAGWDGPDERVELLRAEDADVLLSTLAVAVPDLEDEVAGHLSQEHHHSLERGQRMWVYYSSW